MWRGRSTRVALSAVALACLMTLPGCASADKASDPPAAEPNGVQDLTVDQILSKVQDAVDAATSVHAVGTGASGGSTIEVDLQLGSNGDAMGTLTNNGQEIQIVAVAGTIYFTADASFWTAQAGPDVAAKLAGKYVQVPEGDQTFGSIVDYQGFLGTLVTPEGGVEKGKESTVDGVAVIGLIDTKDKGVMYVSLEGEPLPLKVVPAAGGELLLSDWSADFTVTAPAAEDIVDPNKIISGQ